MLRLRLLPVLLVAPVSLALIPLVGWSELGGSATGGGLSQSPESSMWVDVDVDASGHPIVAWADLSDGMPVKVARWTGTAWASLLGGSETRLSNSLFAGCQVKAGPGGKIYLAWHTGAFGGFFGGNIHLLMWNGLAWIELAGSATGAGISGDTLVRSPALALDLLGHPVVAWQAHANEAKVYAKRWNGSAWVGIAGSDAGLPTGNIASYPVVAVDGEGAVWLAWMEGVFTWKIVARRSTGTDWTDVGGTSPEGLNSPGSIANQPSIAIDGTGAPAIAWAEKVPAGDGTFLMNVVVKRLNGGAWSPPVSTQPVIASIPGQSLGPPTLDSQPGGLLLLAWEQPEESSGQGEILLRAWSPNGTAWDELDGSGGPRGISATDLKSGTPVVAAGPSGGIAVAWMETLDGQTDVHLRTNFRPTGVAASGLRQAKTSGLQAVEVGGIVPLGTPLSLGGFLHGAGLPVSLELELRLVGADFTGTPTHTKPAVSSGTESLREFTDLPAGDYHWRARARTTPTEASDWLSFGSNAETAADFSVAVESSGGGDGGGGGGGGGCGGSAATGAAGLLTALALYSLLRSKMSPTRQ